MSDYILFRLDSRLVHGQVCTAWIPEKEIKRVVIVHDEYAQDEFLVGLHRSVVPAGVVCDTITVKDAVEQWQRDQFGDQRTIVLFQTPEMALAAYEAGIEFKELQIATLAGDKESVVIYKQVNVNSQNAKTCLSRNSV